MRWTGASITNGTTYSSPVTTAQMTVAGTGDAVTVGQSGTYTVTKTADGLYVYGTSGSVFRLDGTLPVAGRNLIAQARVAFDALPSALVEIGGGRTASAFSGLVLLYADNKIGVRTSASADILASKTPVAINADDVYQVDVIFGVNTGTPSTTNGRIVLRVKDITNPTWNTTGEWYYDSGYTTNTGTATSQTVMRWGKIGTAALANGAGLTFGQVGWDSLTTLNTSTDPTVTAAQFMPDPATSTDYTRSASGTGQGDGTASVSVAYTTITSGSGSGAGAATLGSVAVTGSAAGTGSGSGSAAVTTTTVATTAAGTGTGTGTATAATSVTTTTSGTGAGTGAATTAAAYTVTTAGTGAGAGAASATRSTVYDTFDRTNSTTTLGTADTGQAWTSSAGTWGISSNRGFLASGALGLASLPAGVTDGTVVATVVRPSSGTAGLGLRVTGTNSRVSIYMDFTSATVKLSTVNGGTNTDRASVAMPGGIAVGDPVVLRLDVVGSAVAGWVNGVQLLTYTLSGTELTNLSGTGVALRQSVSGNTVTSFDNLSVYNAGAASYVATTTGDSTGTGTASVTGVTATTSSSGTGSGDGAASAAMQVTRTTSGTSTGTGTATASTVVQVATSGTSTGTGAATTSASSGFSRTTAGTGAGTGTASITSTTRNVTTAGSGSGNGSVVVNVAAFTTTTGGSTGTGTATVVVALTATTAGSSSGDGTAGDTLVTYLLVATGTSSGDGTANAGTAHPLRDVTVTILGPYLGPDLRITGPYGDGVPIVGPYNYPLTILGPTE